MRNGNSISMSSWLVLYRVLTVPMRNGNPSMYERLHLRLFCSYRTYEEWKLTHKNQRLEKSKGSYRTYEEWKHDNGFNVSECLDTFLPYLWGMETSESCACRSTGHTSFLPYLWGMETRKIRKDETTGIFVLTVPMRNGNLKQGWMVLFRVLPFLPYLWGMETEICLALALPEWWVLTVPMRNGNRIEAQEDTCNEEFLPYLWGMETKVLQC